MRIRLLFSVIALAACGDRPSVYDTSIDSRSSVFALEHEVAIVDPSADRVVLLTPGVDQTLARRAVQVGHGAVLSQSSADQRRLFVLSTGVTPRRKTTDEAPSLSVIENDVPRTYPMAAPHSSFALDPAGRYVALFAAPGAAQASFVENPNEIVVVDLTAPAETAVTTRTLRSFGGRPQRVSFTPTLQLPGGSRRLLVVETDQEVELLDLDNIRAVPQRPEITVRLTSGADTTVLSPAGIVVDDGDPKKNDDSRIGVRIANDSNVFTITLLAAPSVPGAEANTVTNDFRPEVNLTDVGGVPADIAFVRTDAGLRLAAVVPSTRSAVLVDPLTSITTTVDLPASYSRLSLITSAVKSVGSDTALLYGDLTGGVAFWSLGRATGQPYRSVDVVGLSSPISHAFDVPPPRPELKVLESASSNSFFVLNLATRTASPLETLGHAEVHVASDGQRLWAYQPGTSDLALVTLGDLHPVPVSIERPINQVFDVARADGGRALVAIDNRGAFGATVFDALAPDGATSRSYYGLLLEEL